MGWITGHCHGTRRAPYTVHVEYWLTRSGLIAEMNGVCSCPVKFDCKHAVALLIAGVTHENPQSVIAGPRRAPWKKTLGDIFTHSEGNPVALAFKYSDRARTPPATRMPRTGESPSPGGASHTSLAVRPVTKGKRGTWIAGDVAWSRLRSGYIPDASPRHVAILDELRVLYESSAPYQSLGAWLSLTSMRSPSLWPLLTRAVSAGIPLIDESTGHPVLLETTAGSADVTIRTTADGNLLIRAELAHPDAETTRPFVPIGTPPHGIAWRHAGAIHLAPLAAPASEPWARLHRSPSGILVPATDREDFEKEMLPSIAREGWASPDASYTPTPPPPPALLLTVGYVPAASAGALPQLSLQWSWHYAGDGATPRAPRLALDRRNPSRDWEAENALMTAATTILRSLPRTLEPADSSRLRPRAELRGTDVVTFLEDSLPRLQDAGIYVDRETLPSLRAAAAPTVEVAVEASGRDWFDLDVSVVVDDVTVPIATVLTALTRGDEILFLEDGAYVRLDHPDLDRLRQLLDEARDLTDRRRNALRVPRVRSSWWEDLLGLDLVRASTNSWFDAVRESLANPPAPATLPTGLTARLRPYQRSGFEWLSHLRRSGLGGVLADDMGLGKTVQTIAMILDERENPRADADAAAGSGPPGDTRRPWLVVAPTSVVSNWASEIRKFAPGLRVTTVEATGKRRKHSLDQAVRDADVVVTSYTLLRLEPAEYAALTPAGMVLDEAQQAKNPASKIYAAILQIGAPRVYAITGTPMENNLGELWAMFALTSPGLLGTAPQFTQAFRRPIERGEDERGELMTLLRRRIAPFILRRTKEQVATELPEKQEQILTVELAPAHRRVYDRHLQRERQRILRLSADLDHNRVEVLSALTRLRQLAIDPHLVDEDSHAPSSKLDVLLPLLHEAADEGHRTLVFSQFTRYLHRIAERLAHEGIAYSYLDGGTTGRERVIREFADGSSPVFLISLKAGGVGLNLTMADYVVLTDPWWNPAAEAQAVDRTHRIGQNRSVHVYRLVSTDTIEEKVLALQDSKRALVAGVLAADAAEQSPRDLSDPSAAAPVPSAAGGARLTAEDLHDLLS